MYVYIISCMSNYFFFHIHSKREVLYKLLAHFLRIGIMFFLLHSHCKSKGIDLFLILGVIILFYFQDMENDKLKIKSIICLFILKMRFYLWILDLFLRMGIMFHLLHLHPNWRDRYHIAFLGLLCYLIHNTMDMDKLEIKFNTSVRPKKEVIWWNLSHFLRMGNYISILIWE